MSSERTDFLSKSDFKLAQDCPAKLYYKKRRYPSTNDENPYLQLLARGGFMVEEIARLQYPEGRMVGFDMGRVDALAETQRVLDEVGDADVTLFEPSFESRGRFARVDIFRRLAHTIELIEVKSKSWNSNEPKSEKGSYLTKGGNIHKKWRPYLEDVTFQVLVVEACFPDCTVIPFLFTPDRAKRAERTIVHDRFELTRVVDPNTGYVRSDVSYLGDPGDLYGDHFLIRLNVANAVAMLRDDVDVNADRYVASLNPLAKIDQPVGTHCFNCEYRTGTERDGFAECWGERGRVTPHIADLYRGSQLGAMSAHIRNGFARLTDLDESTFTKQDGSQGTWDLRRIIQVENARADREYVGPGLADVLVGFEYPLHFIDFETSALAVPYHDGMAPYDNVAYQWSCHTIPSPGATPIHSEWINTEDVYPNFGFAESLHREVGDGGTIFIWSQHENTVLRDTCLEMRRCNYVGADVIAWIERIAKMDGKDSTEFVDLYPVCLDHYFHPRMGRRTSIKATVDAEARAALRDALLLYCKLDTAAMVMVWCYWRRRVGLEDDIFA